MVDRPNTTPIGQDKKTLTFKILLYLFRQDHGLDPPCGSHQVFLKLKMLFTSVVASAASTYLRMKDIMRLCANFLWCVPSRWIKNVWFLLAITASKRRNVLFDPYLFNVRPRSARCFVFLSFPRLPHDPNSSPVVSSVFVKISRQAR